jgi:acyl carrier protein
MSAEILERVRRVTVEKLGVKEEEVQPASSFQEDLGFEDEFSINIPDEEVGDIKTVQSAVDYITKKK